MGLEIINEASTEENIIPKMGDIFEWMDDWSDYFICIMTDEKSFVVLSDGTLLENSLLNKGRVIKIIPKDTMFRVI